MFPYRGSSFVNFTASPVTEIQSSVLPSRKESWTSGLASKSLNFVLLAFAKKRKSGPVRFATAMERPTGYEIALACFGVRGGG